MQVFVAYAYNTRTEWIERLVFRLIAALDCLPIDGKIAYGNSLADEVVRLIQSCEVVVVFTTKGGDEGSARISRWVDQELGASIGLKKQVIEVVERESTPQMAMTAGTQRIDYDPDDREECIVKVAEAIKSVRDRLRIRTVKLLPQEVCSQIYPHVGKQSLSCQYRWRRKSTESPLLKASPWRSQGSVFVDLRDVSEEDLIEIRLEFADRSWESDYQPIDAIGIELREAKR
jgi:hypothetical protein